MGLPGLSTCLTLPLNFNLESLNSHRTSRYSHFPSDVGVKAISVSCPQLRELSLSDCPQITDHGLWQLARLGPSLRCTYSRINFHFELLMINVFQVSFNSKVLPNLRPRPPPGLPDRSEILQIELLTIFFNGSGVDTLLQASLPQPAWLPSHNRRQVCILY